jgi:hypothetical protein
VPEQGVTVPVKGVSALVIPFSVPVKGVSVPVKGVSALVILFSAPEKVMVLDPLSSDAARTQQHVEARTRAEASAALHGDAHLRAHSAGGWPDPASLLKLAGFTESGWV